MMRPEGGELDEGSNPLQQFVAHTTVAQQRAQAFLDSTTPHVTQRWLTTAGLLVLFMLRIVLSQGWYIVCYALFIYLLNLFLAFLQPKFDPSYDHDLAEQDVEEGEPGLPTSATPSSRNNFGLGSGGTAAAGGLMSGVFGGGGAAAQNGRAGPPEEEFRPFIRRLPEFKFWLSATQAILISLVCTLTELCDVPVYWPILLVYFLILFALTMRRQIQHMIKYKYVPFDLGRKQRYV
ncbi:hypothetical protein OC834_005641 [Tilletia horrida]|uniref:Protein RER1 n=1 Tax=Tilletia horrida TaxID=155126 RepID=A0AAN6GHP0_9BASI|nr:hypothetical protein OC834_005641 [Tilletia horrida]KAK0531443.1 hypothetical protein OC835_003661 [Tilletia horrida]KAK0541305.1 hypothetical protein OC842_000010 [Tilletia horrida]KAK0563881.1 hypothetical protein OC844_001979 [Tilletia horrida]